MPSAMAMSSGIPIPNTANTMWKASDMAICERAKRKSLIQYSVAGFRFQSTQRTISRSRRREEAERSQQMRALSIRLLTSAATLGFRTLHRIGFSAELGCLMRAFVDSAFRSLGGRITIGRIALASGGYAVPAILERTLG